MTNPDYPGEQSPQYSPTQPVSPPGWQGYEVPKKKSKKPMVIGIVVAAMGLCCAGVVASIANSDSAKQGFNDGLKTATSGSPSPSNSKPAPLPTKGAPQKHTPIPAEIKLTIKITKKQCFGTAGCLVDFRIDNLSYIGEPMDKDKSYEVVYEVSGLKDPYTNSLTLNGDGQFEYQKEENGQTPTTKVKLAAKVVSVEEM